MRPINSANSAMLCETEILLYFHFEVKNLTKSLPTTTHSSEPPSSVRKAKRYPMKLNEEDWRPITFEGHELPASLMGIDTLEKILEFDDEDLGSLLFRLCVCKGVTKSAGMRRCHKNSKKALRLIKENEDAVKAGIRERLGPHGFDAEQTVADWISSLEVIRNNSRKFFGKCYWSAPLHKNDRYQTKEDIDVADLKKNDCRLESILIFVDP